MENNWGEFAFSLMYKHIDSSVLNEYLEEVIQNTVLEAMNLVFEATKKECADKADTKREYNFLGEEWIIDKESILNINKPNL